MDNIFPKKFSPLWICWLLLGAALPSCSKWQRLTGAERVVEVKIGSSGAPESLSAKNGRAGVVIPAQSGGVMVWAKNTTLNRVAAVLLPTETATTSVTLEFGQWDFYALGFEGPDIFDGNGRCGKTSQDINSSTTSVNVVINQTNCSAMPFFGNSALKQVRFVTCNSLQNVTGGASLCGGIDRGDLRSFQVTAIGYNSFTPAPGAPPPLSGSRTSRCVTLANPSTDSSVESNFLVPDGEATGSPIYFLVSGFTGTACSGTKVDFHFPSGLRGGSPSGLTRMITGANPYLNSNALFLVSGARPAPLISSILPASGGWGGGQVVNIVGSNLEPMSTVTIGGLNCPIAGTPTSAQISCTIPKNANLGTKSLVVTNTDGQMATGSFVYVNDGFGLATDASDSNVGSSFTVSFSLITDTAGSLGSRSFHSYRSIAAIASQTVGGDLAGKTVTLVNTPQITSSDFAVGDTVLWHVSAASSACSAGSDLPTGKYGVSLVSAVDLTNGKVTLSDVITNTPVNTNIGNPNRVFGQNFCAMQLVRMASFQDLNLGTSSNGNTVIQPPAFSLSSGAGGILAIQVNGALNINGTAGKLVYFSADGRGFGWGVLSTQGMGNLGEGRSSVQAPNGSGGGAGGTGSGGAGGGNFGPGGNGGGTVPGSGGIGNSTCNPFGLSCAPIGGGGGGSPTWPGGNGGGIVLVWARNVAQTVGFYLSANGTQGVGGSGAGGGGGAGGTAFLRTINAVGATLNLQATGAPGGSASAAGGGGGGGGWAYHVGCASTQPSTVNSILIGGNAGTGAGPVALPGGNGSGGNSLYAGGNFFCP